MSRSRALACLAAATLAVGGCSQTLDDNLTPGPNFLRLQSWVAVSADGATTAGFIRWVYLVDDPSSTDEPVEHCEIWEQLDLDRASTAGCDACSDVWTGTATVEVDEATCAGVDWSERAIGLGFGPMGAAPAEVVAMEADGFTHAVYLNWAPDRGDLPSYEALFVAQPERWSNDVAPLGTSGAAAVSGDYGPTSLYFWDTRE